MEQIEEIDEIDRKILQLKMEELSLRQESDAASKERLGRLEEELLELRNQQASLNEQWQKEKGAINQIQVMFDYGINKVLLANQLLGKFSVSL